MFWTGHVYGLEIVMASHVLAIHGYGCIYVSSIVGSLIAMKGESMILKYHQYGSKVGHHGKMTTYLCMKFTFHCSPKEIPIKLQMNLKGDYKIEFFYGYRLNETIIFKNLHILLYLIENTSPLFYYVLQGDNIK